MCENRRWDGAVRNNLTLRIRSRVGFGTADHSDCYRHTNDDIHSAQPDGKHKNQFRVGEDESNYEFEGGGFPGRRRVRHVTGAIVSFSGRSVLTSITVHCGLWPTSAGLRFGAPRKQCCLSMAVRTPCSISRW